MLDPNQNVCRVWLSRSVSDRPITLTRASPGRRTPHGSHRPVLRRGWKTGSEAPSPPSPTRYFPRKVRWSLIFASWGLRSYNDKAAYARVSGGRGRLPLWRLDVRRPQPGHATAKFRHDVISTRLPSTLSECAPQQPRPRTADGYVQGGCGATVAAHRTAPQPDRAPAEAQCLVMECFTAKRAGSRQNCHDGVWNKLIWAVSFG
jgi:hypothetical protein